MKLKNLKNQGDESRAVNIVTERILKEKKFDIKSLEDWILDLMYFDENKGPSHVLTTIGVFLCINNSFNKNPNQNKIKMPAQEVMKNIEKLGILCELERFRRVDMIDYEIDKDFLDPEANITIQKKPNWDLYRPFFEK
jgi:hypothetical protein